jgi:hypothetical protein
MSSKKGVQGSQAIFYPYFKETELQDYNGLKVT